MAIDRHHESRWRDRIKVHWHSSTVDCLGKLGSGCPYQKINLTKWNLQTKMVDITITIGKSFFGFSLENRKFLEYSYSSNPFQPSYPLQQLLPIPQGVPHLQLHLFTFFHGLNDLHLSQTSPPKPLPTATSWGFCWGLDVQHIPLSALSEFGEIVW